MGNITSGPRLWQEISCTSPVSPVSACSPPPHRWRSWTNLSRHLGGPEIWIKRDDCTVVATGGNKVRKLEWLVGEAQALGANHLVTQGAVQSNHVRQTAAVARRFGMKCTALLEHRIDTNDRDYLNSGNVLLDRLFDTAIEYRPGGTDMNAAAEAKGEALRAAGEKPYVIPGGGSNRVGALGYVSCAQELMHQADEMGLRIDRVVTATGQCRNPGGAGGRAGRQQCRHSGAGHWRPRAEGPTGGQRAPCWRRRPRTMSACAAALRARR